MEESSFACFYCKQCASRFQIADKGVDDLGFQRVYCSNEGCPAHNHDFYVCQTCFQHGEQVNSILSNARHKHRKASIHQTAANELLSNEQKLKTLKSSNEEPAVPARLSGLMDKHFQTSGSDLYFRREISNPGSGI